MDFRIRGKARPCKHITLILGQLGAREEPGRWRDGLQALVGAFSYCFPASPLLPCRHRCLPTAARPPLLAHRCAPTAARPPLLATQAH